MTSQRIAVILMNLGGPDQPAAVKPFLRNLFNDPNILTVPAPLRTVLAWIISTTREKTAQASYDEMGGGSPILPNTQAQATALDAALATAGLTAKCFVCMRHWHPMTPEVVAAVKAYAPDQVVLLPLYPQYSTTTTKSSREAWMTEAGKQGLTVPTTTICCYPTEDGFIRANAELIRPVLAEAAQHGRPRVLFSAHSLPQKIVDAGDPYQVQCVLTGQAIADALGDPDLDWHSTYQSKVGPLPWLEPSTEQAIEQAAKDGVPVVLVPMSFVSEHVETTVELGIEYRELAERLGLSFYGVVPAVAVHQAFIAGLAGLVGRAAQTDAALLSQTGARLCPCGFGACPWPLRSTMDSAAVAG